MSVIKVVGWNCAGAFKRKVLVEGRCFCFLHDSDVVFICETESKACMTNSLKGVAHPKEFTKFSKPRTRGSGGGTSIMAMVRSSLLDSGLVTVKTDSLAETVIVIEVGARMRGRSVCDRGVRRMALIGVYLPPENASGTGVCERESLGPALRGLSGCTETPTILRTTFLMCYSSATPTAGLVACQTANCAC